MSRISSACAVFAIVSVMASVGLRAQEAGEKAPAGGGTDAEAEGDGILQDAIGKLIPEGQASLNVTIPGFSEGILKTLVKAASITRIDDETLEMVEMLIEMYGTDGKSELAIEVEAATFDMASGILESQQPAKISNDQFDIVGERLVYDTRLERGKLLGKVTMYVYTSGEGTEEKGGKNE